MAKSSATLTLLALAGIAAAAAAAGGEDTKVLNMNKIGGYSHKDEDGEEPFEFEITAAKFSSKLLFVTAKQGLAVFRWNDAGGIDRVLTTMTTDMLDGATPTSISYSEERDSLAVSVAPDDLLKQGTVYIIPDITAWEKCDFCDFYDVEVLPAGYHPDMVTFTPDGNHVLVANEGEPDNYDGEGDPVGSISIYSYIASSSHHYEDDESHSYSYSYGSYSYSYSYGSYSYSYNFEFSEPCTADFSEFDGMMEELKSIGVRVTGTDSTTVSEDMEPEYIAVSSDSKWAYVTLQENNAVAKVDIEACTVTEILPLGYKNWGERDSEGKEMMFDGSDRDESINRKPWPVMGMYMPDGIGTYDVGGKTYFVTANEGDAREVGDVDDDKRVENIVEDILDGADYGGDMSLFSNEGFGRLKVSKVFPFEEPDNLEDAVFYAFGCRSFSIFDSDANLVYDSGDFMGAYIETYLPEFFNSEGTTESLDVRSDKQGVEPESITIAEIHGRTFVFVGLERVGGWMCWDISDPHNPVFQSYVNPIDEYDSTRMADIDPESSVFIPAEHGVGGKALLIAAYTETASIAVFEITFVDNGNGNGNGGGGDTGSYSYSYEYSYAF